MAVSAYDFTFGDLISKTFLSSGVDEFRNQTFFVLKIVEVHRLDREPPATVGARGRFEKANEFFVSSDASSASRSQNRQVSCLVSRLAVPLSPRIV
jgi:hypothetical protein